MAAMQWPMERFFSDEEGSSQAAIRIAIFVTQNSRQASAPPGRKKDMRHGIARMRRHVAPARLLC
jgi:hypothetical protein